MPLRKRSQLSSLAIQSGGKLYLDTPTNSVYFRFDGVNANFIGANLILTGGTYLCQGVQIGAGSGQITTNLNNTLKLNSSVADGTAAVGVAIGPAVNFTTSGSKLLSVQNATVEKLYVDKDGGLVASGPVTASYIQAGNGSSEFIGARVRAGVAGPVTIQGAAANGGTAVILKQGDTDLTNAGSKLVSIVNNATEKAYVDKDGKVGTPAVIFGDATTQTTAYVGVGAALVFGGSTVTNNHYLIPGYGTSVAAAVEVPAPYVGTVDSFVVNLGTAAGTTCTATLYKNGVSIATLDITGGTAAAMEPATAMTVGDRLSVQITFTGTAPTKVVAVVGLVNSAVGALYGPGI